MLEHPLQEICRKLKPILGRQADSLWLSYITAETGPHRLQAESLIQMMASRHLQTSVDDNRISDLHIWSIGPGIYSATIAVVSDAPKSPEYYKNLIPKDLGIVHTIVEVHHCQD